MWSVAHSCGQTCRRKFPCNHVCLLLCHPGQCPACPKIVETSCFCAKSAPKALRCFQSRWSCLKPCGKKLSCNLHRCEAICHEGIYVFFMEKLHFVCEFEIFLIFERINRFLPYLTFFGSFYDVLYDSVVLICIKKAIYIDYCWLIFLMFQNLRILFSNLPIFFVQIVFPLFHLKICYQTYFPMQIYRIRRVSNLSGKVPPQLRLRSLQPVAAVSGDELVMWPGLRQSLDLWPALVPFEMPLGCLCRLCIHRSALLSVWQNGIWCR